MHFVRHLMKCISNNGGREVWSICPFNVKHCVLKENYVEHVKNCVDRQDFVREDPVIKMNVVDPLSRELEGYEEEFWD